MTEYPYRVRVTSEGMPPPLVLERLDERYLNVDEYTGGGAHKAIVADKAFGVVGDGTTDDTAAIQKALDATASAATFVANGAAAFLPAGRYKITGAGLRLRTGTTLMGEPGTVLVTDDPLLENFIRAFGSYLAASERELATAVNAGDRVITTKTAHGLKVGDTIKIQSQRIATSADAGEDRLGWATIGGQGPFFAEYGTVSQVNSTTQFTLEKGLVFNGYRPDRTQETDEYAGTSTKILVTNKNADRVTVRDLDIDGTCKAAIRIIRAVDARVENVRVRLPIPSRAVAFEDVYKTEAYNVHVYADTVLEDAADHAIQNVFHMAGSQSSGFNRCSTFRGAQCYDITYNNTTPHPSVHCYITNCASFSALFNPVTLHPGIYGCWVTGNNFSECRQAGISIRSNSARVQNNTVTGSMWYNTSGSGGSGIYLLEGAGKGSLISGNLVENFATGMRVNDGANKPFQGWIGATITGNVFRNFDRGFSRVVDSSSPVPSSSVGIILSGNTFVSTRNNATGFITCENGRGIHGLEISSNSIRLSGSNTVGVQVTANSLETIVKNNVFHDVGQALGWDPVGWGTESRQSVVHWLDNTVVRAAIDRTPPPSSQFQVHSDLDTVHRLPDTEFSLNDVLYSGRWYASTSAATVARGYPQDGFAGWVDSHRITGSLVKHVAHYSDGRTKTRTYDGAWTAWV